MCETGLARVSSPWRSHTGRSGRGWLGIGRTGGQHQAPRRGGLIPSWGISRHEGDLDLCAVPQPARPARRPPTRAAVTTWRPFSATCPPTSVVPALRALAAAGSASRQRCCSRSPGCSPEGSRRRREPPMARWLRNSLQITGHSATSRPFACRWRFQRRASPTEHPAVLLGVAPGHRVHGESLSYGTAGGSSHLGAALRIVKQRVHRSDQPVDVAGLHE